MYSIHILCMCISVCAYACMHVAFVLNFHSLTLCDVLCQNAAEEEARDSGSACLAGSAWHKLKMWHCWTT